MKATTRITPIVVAACAFGLLAAIPGRSPGPAAAQENDGAFSPPHRIASVALEEGPSGPLLKVGGVFNPERFGDVLVLPLEGASAYSIEIPGALADSALPASRDFPGGAPLQRVDISAVAHPEDPALGLVILVAQVAPGATVRFLPEASNATGMAFAISAAEAAPPPGTAGAMVEGMGDEPGMVGIENPAWQGRPTRVRIAVLNGSGVAGKAGQVGILLGEVRRRRLEARLGQRVEMVNISNATRFDREETVVYYRPGFLRAALMIAKTLPGDQHVSPMKPASLRRNGIDVEILLGKDMP